MSRRSPISQLVCFGGRQTILGSGTGTMMSTWDRTRNTATKLDARGRVSQRMCGLVIIPETVNVSFYPMADARIIIVCYTLFVRGVGFHLLVGNRIPAAAKQMGFISGAGNPTLRNDLLEKSNNSKCLRKVSLVLAIVEKVRTAVR